MSIAKEAKQKAIKQLATNEKDTGSPEVQVSILTLRINNLTEHLKSNKKDLHSRTGLMRQVGQRKRLLKYLQSKDPGRYKKVLEALNLRK